VGRADVGRLKAYCEQAHLTLEQSSRATAVYVLWAQRSFGKAETGSRIVTTRPKAGFSESIRVDCKLFTEAEKLHGN